MADIVRGGRTEDADEAEELSYRVRNPFRVHLKEQRKLYPEYLLRAMKKLDAMSLSEEEY